MKAYKLLKNINNLLTVGRVICPYNNVKVLIATPTKPQSFILYDPEYFVKQGVAEEIILENEIKLKPHFYKPIKLALQ